LHGRGYGTVIGCLMGILLDIFIGKTLGIYGAILGFTRICRRTARKEIF